jgi:hypothetical protein
MAIKGNESIDRVKNTNDKNNINMNDEYRWNVVKPQHWLSVLSPMSLERYYLLELNLILIPC